MTTAGTWKINLTSGSPSSTASYTIPAGGITVTESGCGSITNTAPFTTAGAAWQNGTTSPLVASTFNPGWGAFGFGGCGQVWLQTSANEPFHITDTTQPTSVIAVGP